MADGTSARVAAVFARGAQYHQAGRYAEAEACYREALSLDSRHADSLHLLGVLAHQVGRHDAAIELIGQAIGVNAKVPQYHNNLGLARKARGDLTGAAAALRQALRLKRDYAEAHNNLGNVLEGQGKALAASAIFQEAIVWRPDFAGSYNNLGAAQKTGGRFATAASSLYRCLVLRPDFLDARYNLGLVLQGLNEPEAAADSFAAVLGVHPDHVDARNNLGNTLQRLVRPDEAARQFHLVLTLKPDFAIAWGNLANVLGELGRTPAKLAAASRAIALEPRQGSFHHGFAESWRFKLDDPRIADMEALLRSDLSNDDRTWLHFALGKAWDDVGAYDRAFAHFKAGNALHRQTIDYDEAATLAELERIAGQPVGTAHDACETDRPIFVVGMPRSGTSLIEQILASHPDVHGAGELSALSDAVRRFPSDLAALGREYDDTLRRLAPVARRVVDKMPGNFKYIGLIHKTLPRARIIHLTREPLDTCLSCYTKMFTDYQPYTYDLLELGRYWRAYDRLMAHWRAVLPGGAFLDVAYEAVVADLEGEARRLLDFAGLSWDPRCLSFHATERSVRTASAAQVREPLYNRSVGRWKSYRVALDPLRRTIEAGKIDS